MSDPAAKNPNLSLQRKSASRMVAVQYAYQAAMNVGDATIDEQLAQVKAQLAGNRDEQKLLIGAAIEPDYAMAKQLLMGMAEHKDAVLAHIDSKLSAGWKRERMGHLMVSLLQCATFEMFFHKNLNAKIIVDEYTRIARSFFADDEVDFVHALLNALAKAHG